MGNQVVLHALNPSTQETGKSLSFKFSLVCTVPHQPGLYYETLSEKKRQTGFSLVTHASNPSTWEIEAGRAGVQGHPQLLQDQFELYEIVSQNNK